MFTFCPWEPPSALVLTFHLLPRPVGSVSMASLPSSDLLFHGCCLGSGLIIFSLHGFHSPLPASSPGLASSDHTHPGAGGSLSDPPLPPASSDGLPLVTATAMHECLPPACPTLTLTVIHDKPSASTLKKSQALVDMYTLSPHACHIWALALQSPSIRSPVWSRRLSRSLLSKGVGLVSAACWQYCISLHLRSNIANIF